MPVQSEWVKDLGTSGVALFIRQGRNIDKNGESGNTYIEGRSRARARAREGIYEEGNIWT
jgi:hypothetical protein